MVGTFNWEGMKQEQVHRSGLLSYMRRAIVTRFGKGRYNVFESVNGDGTSDYTLGFVS